MADTSNTSIFNFKETLNDSALASLSTNARSFFASDTSDTITACNLQYPNDILGNTQGTLGKGNTAYGGAYTVFIINVVKDSTIATRGLTSTQTVTTKGRESAALFTDSGAENFEKFGTVASGAVVGAAVTGKISNASGQTAIQKARSALANASFTKVGVGVVAGAAATYTLSNSDSLKVRTGMKTQQACIVLPTPRIDTNYQFSWSQTPNKIVSGASSVLNSDDKFKSLVNAATSAASNIDAIGVTSKTAVNPRKEQRFDEVAFRHFNFEYVFAPTSPDEARNVEAIVKMFKYHAHPELQAGGFTLIYPSEFIITHFVNGKENTHLPKHLTSVLKSVNVEYSDAQGSMMFFRDSQGNMTGQPITVKLTLEFEELNFLTKQDIAEGY